MSMKFRNGKLTICEVLRRINDRLQANNYSTERELLSLAEIMAKKMDSKLREYNQEFDKEFWEDNREFAETRVREENIYKTGNFNEIKILVLIIAVNFPYYKDVAVKAITKYYNHFGIDVKVLEENHPIVQAANTSPVWNKMFAFDLFPEYDFVIAQDLDILPCNLYYDIRDFIDFTRINMCIDYTRIGLHYLNIETNIDRTSHPHFWYNAGLLAYPKTLTSFMRKVYDKGIGDPHSWGTYDQYYLNQLIGDSRMYINILPQLFNVFYTPEINYERTAFCHYTLSMTTTEKRSIIINHHPKGMLA